MLTLIALLCLALAAACYVYINAIVVGWLMRRALPLVMPVLMLLVKQEGRRFKQFLRTEANALSNTRIWATIALQLVAMLFFAYAVLQPLSPLALGTLLLGFSFMVSAATLSLLKQLPSVQRLWDDAIVRIALLALPAYFVFIARGYANVWVGELLGVSASNASSALFAATVFLLCVVPSWLLLIATLVFEVAVMVVPSALPKNSGKKASLMVLLGVSLIAVLAAHEAVRQPPSSRVGSRLLAAIAFEFDAAPANRCELTENERRQVELDEPFIKALYLSTSQDRALLVKRGPALFRPVVLRDLKSMDAKALLIPIRVVECFKPEPERLASPSSSPK